MEENLADLRAQVAATRLGERLLGELVERYGRNVTDAYRVHVQDDAERLVRRAIAALPSSFL